jgi:hypothetical protein
MDLITLKDMSKNTTLKPIETLEYKVYRGHLEPIIEQRKAELKFYDNYLEIVVDYDVEVYGGEVEHIIHAVLINKYEIGVELGEWYSDNDPKKLCYPRLTIQPSNFNIYVEEMNTATEIYNKIKRWLLE